MSSGYSSKARPSANAFASALAVLAPVCGRGINAASPARSALPCTIPRDGEILLPAVDAGHQFRKFGFRHVPIPDPIDTTFSQFSFPLRAGNEVISPPNDPPAMMAFLLTIFDTFRPLRRLVLTARDPNHNVGTPDRRCLDYVASLGSKPRRRSHRVRSSFVGSAPESIRIFRLRYPDTGESTPMS
jgi:hypothetical protein